MTTMFKNILCTLLFAAGVFFPTLAFAGTFDGGELYTLKGDNVVLDNLYVGAGDITIAGGVLGDVTAAGGSIVLSGDVRDDLTAVGGDITVLSRIGEDARIAGGNILINGKVGGDLVVAGGVIKILDGVTVGKDAVLAGGSVSVDGRVLGDAQISGGQIIINATIDGDVVVNAGEKLILGENAHILGSLTYRGESEDILDANENAQVAGGITYEAQKFADKKQFARGIAAFAGTLLFIKFLTTLIAAVIVVLVFGRFSRSLADDAFDDPWMNILRGFIVLVIVPIAAIALFATVLGALVGMFAMVSYVLMLMVASLYSGVLFGLWLHKLIKKGNHDLDWRHAAFGVALITFLKFVPIVGWIMVCGFFLLSLGATANMFYQKLWLKR